MIENGKKCDCAVKIHSIHHGNKLTVWGKMTKLYKVKIVCEVGCAVCTAVYDFLRWVNWFKGGLLHGTNSYSYGY